MVLSKFLIRSSSTDDVSHTTGDVSVSDVDDVVYYSRLNKSVTGVHLFLLQCLMFHCIQ